MPDCWSTGDQAATAYTRQLQTMYVLGPSPSGTTVTRQLSKSTVGIPPAKPAMSASTSWKIFHWTCANGCVQSVASAMTGISMLQEIFWPRGSRHRPVEEVSDLLRDARA